VKSSCAERSGSMEEGDGGRAEGTRRVDPAPWTVDPREEDGRGRAGGWGGGRPPPPGGEGQLVDVNKGVACGVLVGVLESKDKSSQSGGRGGPGDRGCVCGPMPSQQRLRGRRRRHMSTS
jgi:hypothetical protein